MFRSAEARSSNFQWRLDEKFGPGWINDERRKKVLGLSTDDDVMMTLDMNACV